MADKNHILLLGAHTSAAGGFHEAIDRAVSIGCTTLQIFTKNNRQWGVKPILEDEANLFKKAVTLSGITSVLAHAAYLINIGSDNELIRQKSVDALVDELKRCDQLDIPYLVLHPGSRGQNSEELFLELVAQNLDIAFEKANTRTMILLETMAGQGNSVGHKFEHLAQIYRMVKNKNQIGVCLDTCHIFAAGYDFRSKASYEKLWADFDSTIGITNLKAIHINDSKKGLGSLVDRHEHIGKGEIGAAGFGLLFNDKRLFSIPKILETPKDDLIEDLRNMQFIVGLIDSENKKSMVIKVTEAVMSKARGNEQVIDKK